MAVLTIIAQWGLGAVAFLVLATAISIVLMFLFSPEMEEVRRGVVFLLVAAGMIAALTTGMWSFGAFLWHAFVNPPENHALIPSEASTGKDSA